MDDLLIVECVLYPVVENEKDSVIEIAQNSWFPYEGRPSSPETKRDMARNGRCSVPREIMEYLTGAGKEIFWECSLLGSDSVKLRLFFMDGELHNIIVLF